MAVQGLHCCAEQYEGCGCKEILCLCRMKFVELRHILVSGPILILEILTVL